MKSDEYWQKRMEALNEAELKKGEDYIKQQQIEYEKAIARIKKETESWYSRVAKNNNVSMAEARKLLTANELKEFHWDVEEYINRGRDNAIDQRWMKQLENASAKVHITRLEEIELKTRQELEMLTARRLKGTTEVMADIYKDGYYKGIYEVQRGVGHGLPFAKLDVRQIDKVLSKPWAPDGRNFSARIWGDRDKLVAELQTVLTQDLIRGGNVERVISEFTKRMNVSKHAAERLIRTEAAYFSGQSRIDGYKETGVKHYKYVATMDARTSDQCRDMEGKTMPLSEAQAGVNYPPLHAYCRSTTIPHFEDDGEVENDEGYEVQEDETYKDWEKEHIPEVEEQIEITIPKAKEPTKSEPVVALEPEEVFTESKEALEELYDEVVKEEPVITKVVTKVIEANKGKMEGLEFRLKTKDSFSRKVLTDFINEFQIDPSITVIDVAKSINDAVRYTAVADSDRLFTLYSTTIMTLINEGHSLKKVKNSWLDKNNPYNGVNVILVAPNGQPYELQFHTPESFDLKQNRMHEYYEEYRLPSTTKERKIELWNLMLEMADGIKKPKDIDQIKG